MKKMYMFWVSVFLLISNVGFSQFELTDEGQEYNFDAEILSGAFNGSGVDPSPGAGEFDSDLVSFDFDGTTTGFGNATTTNFFGTTASLGDTTNLGFGIIDNGTRFLGLVPKSSGQYYVYFQLQAGPNYVLNELTFSYRFNGEQLSSSHQTQVGLPQFSLDLVDGNFNDMADGSGATFSSHPGGFATSVDYTKSNVYVPKGGTFYVRIPINVVNNAGSTQTRGDVIGFSSLKFKGVQYPLVRFEISQPDPIVVNDESNGSFDVDLEVVHPSYGANVQEDISVEIQIIGGTAEVDNLDGLDPNTFSQIVTWNTGDNVLKTVTIPFINDNENETNENFTLFITTAPAETKSRILQNADGGQSSQDIQIIDDDSPVVEFVNIRDTIVEGSGGGTRLVAFDVILDNEYPLSEGKTTEVDILISGAPGATTATSGGVDFDFSAASPSVSWGPGETGVKTVTFQINEDDLIEGFEKFTLELSAITPPAVTIGANSAMEIVIEDDDDMIFNFVQNNSTPFAGDENVIGNEDGGVVYDVRVLVDKAHQNEDVDFTIGLDGNLTPTLAEGRDYEILVGGAVTATSGGILGLTIPQNATFVDFQIRILDDQLVESIEQEMLVFDSLPDPYGTEGPNNTHTIEVDDPEDKSVVRFSSADATVSEPTGSVTRSLIIENPNVNYPTQVDIGQDIGGLAVLGTDFEFDAGQTSFIIGAAGDPGHAGPAPDSIRVFTIAAKDDPIVEGTEDRTVRITNVSPWANLDLASYEMDITVLDDDQSTVQFTFPSSSFLETNGTDQIQLSLDNPNVNYPITVTIDTVNTVPGVGIATYGDDHTVPTGGGPIPFQVTFPKNTTSIDFSFDIINDLIVEGNETFAVDITAANQNTAIASPGFRHEVTIIDDDETTLTFTTASRTLTEPAAQTTYNSQVNLSQINAGSAITFDVVLVAAGNATNNVDFIFATQSITYNIGESGNKDVTFDLLPDAFAEGTENFYIEIINVSPASTNKGILTHEVVIEDDESLEISFDAVSTTDNEDNGVDVFIYASSNAGSVNGPTTVDLVALGSSTAQLGTDIIIVQPASGQLTFPANVPSTQTIRVRIIDDALLEGNENLVLGFANPSNGATIGNTFDTHTVSIIDDEQGDLEGYFTSDAQSVVEGTSGPGNQVNVPIEITGLPETGYVIVEMTVSGASTATEGGGNDFSAAVYEMRFYPTDGLSKNFVVNIDEDALIEGDETAILNITNVEWRDSGDNTIQSGAAGTFSQHTITILDDDFANVNFSQATLSDDEDDGANGTAVTLTVELDNTAGEDVVVRLVPTDGLAQKGRDYEWYDGSSNVISDVLVTIPAGSTSASYTTSSFLFDEIVEGDEDFSVEVFVVSGPANTGVQNTIDITIEDDDRGEFTLVALDGNQNDEGLGNNFKIVFSKDIENVSVNVDLALTGGDAELSDYGNFIVNPFIFSAGQSEKFVYIPYINDGIVENIESFDFALASPTALYADIALTNNSLTYNIISNDESTVEFDVSSLQVNEPAGTATLSISIDKGHEDLNTRVSLSDIGGGLAALGVDYTLVTPQDVIFGNGAGSTETVTVNLINDNNVEGSESTNFRISRGVVNPIYSEFYSIGIKDEMELEILDDDNLVLDLSPLTPTIVEDNAAGTIATTQTFTITATPVHQNEDVTVEVELVENELAVYKQDFDWTESFTKVAVITIPAGNATATFDVRTIADKVVEGPELFDVRIQNPSNGTTIGATPATLEITDNDETTVSLQTISDQPEGGSVTVVAELDPAISVENLTLQVDLQGGVDGGGDDATQNTDYTFANQTLSFPAGTKQASVTIPLVDDGNVEGDEDVQMILTNPQDVNYVKLGAADQQEFFILDNDSSIVQFATSTGTMVEGAAGASTTFSVDISLDQAPVSGVNVDITFTNGLATVGNNDFAQTTLSVPFAAGETGPKTVNFEIKGDDIVEGDEDFQINIGTITGKAKAGAISTVDVTITDDDQMVLGIVNGGSTNVPEGSSENIQFVWLTEAERGTVTFDLVDHLGAIAQNSNEPVPDLDQPDTKAYSKDIAGVKVNDTFTVPLNYVQDVLREGNEGFGFQIQNLVGAVSNGNDTFIRVITDDDESIFSFQVLNTDVAEASGTYSLEVKVDFLNENYDLRVDIADITVPGVGKATLATDYTWASPQTLVFSPGSANSQFITITITDDAVDELDETADIELSNPLALGNSLVSVDPAKDEFELTIIDDEVPQIDFQSVAATFNENNGGTNLMLTIDMAPVTDVTVAITAFDLGSINQLPVKDVTFPGTMSVNFPAGQTAARPFVVTLNDDFLVEGTEQFRVQGAISSGDATIVQDFMVVDVLDDDVAVVEFDNVSPAAATKDESDSPLRYRVSLNNGLEHQSVTVNLTKTAGEVTMGTDVTYGGAPGSYTFQFVPGGALIEDVDLTIIDDVLLEGDEDLTLDLTVSANASLGATTSRTKTIVDNESAEVFISNFGVGNDVNEGNSLFVEIASSLAHENEDIQVDLVSLGASVASEGADFDFLASPVTIPAGSTGPIQVEFKTIDDTDIEGDEDYYLQLQNLVVADPNVSLRAGELDYSGTIIDNDIPIVEVVTSAVTINEGLGLVQIEVNLDRPHQTQTVTAKFDFETLGEAQHILDFDSAVNPFEVNWPAGTFGNKFIDVSINDDIIVEALERFRVKLKTVQNAVMGTNRTAMVSIEDNDNATATFVSDVVVNENAGSATVQVTLDKLHQTEQTEVWVDLNGAFVAPNFPATDGADFDGSGLVTKLFFPIDGGGSNTQSVTIPLFDDPLVEGTEEFGLHVVFASAWVDLSNNPEAMVTINDIGESTEIHFNPELSTVNEGDGSYSFSLEITNPNVNEDTDVDVVLGTSLSGTNATPTADYDISPAVGTFTFPAGSTAPKVFDVNITDDALAEGLEYVLYELANPSSWVTSSSSTHELTIVDNETPTVQFVNTTGTFVEGSGTYAVELELNQPTTAGDVTIDVAALAGIYPFAEAKEGPSPAGDYEMPATNTVTWTVGESGVKTLVLNVGQDDFVEGDEFFDLRLENLLVGGAASTAVTTGGNTVHSLTVEDDDRTIVDFVVANSTNSEAAGSGTVSILMQGVNVNYPTVLKPNFLGGLAQAAGVDFAWADSLVVPSITEADYNGANDQDVVVAYPWSIVDDAIVEGDENHGVSLQSTDYWFELGTTTPNHDFLIQDNDVSTLSFAFDEYSVFEDDGNVIVQVNIDNPNVNAATTVDVVVLTGFPNEAVNGVDYNFTDPTTLTFPAGDGSPQTVTISINDDLLSEGEELFVLGLTNNAPIPTTAIDGALGQTDVRIIDNDAPVLSFRDVVLTEAEDVPGGPSDETYTVTIDVTNPPTTLVAETKVRVDLSNGLTGVTAQYPSDVKLGTSADPDANFLVLDVLQNQTEITFEITHIYDLLVEGDETFHLEMSSPNNDISFIDREADGTITDNDFSTLSILSISDVDENAGTANVEIGLDAYNVNHPTEVEINATGGVAVFNVDYEYVSGSNIITFPSGTGVPPSINFAIRGIDDLQWEELEDFILTLENPSPWANVSGAQGSGTANVIDDEIPEVNFARVSYVANEADASLDVELKLSHPNENYPLNVSFNLAASTNGGTLSPLTPNADYTATPDGFGGFAESVTFAPGETFKVVSLPILQDPNLEGTEFGGGKLISDPRFTSTQDTTTIVLEDDDFAVIRFVEVETSAAEGITLPLEVELDRPIAADSKLEITFDIERSANSVAQEVLDFNGPAALPISMKFTAADNPPVKSGNWSMVDDAIVEGTEELILKIKNPTPGATVGALDSLILNILDNEVSDVQFKLPNSAVLEEDVNASHNVGVFITNPNVNDTTFVDVGLIGGTALAGTDFNYATQTVFFPPNAAGDDTLKFITIGLIDDAIPEGLETIDLTLQNLLPNNTVQVAPGGNVNHTVNITDEDAPDVFFVKDSVNVDEETQVYQITLGISNPNVNYPTIVDVSDVEGFAVDGVDYNFGAGPKTVTFPANNTLNQTVDFDVIEDAIVEGWHDFDLQLSNTTPGQFVQFSNPDVRVFIIDDDSSDVSFNVASQTVSEGAGTVNVQVNITNPPIHHPMKVGVVLTGGDATNVDDFSYPLTQSVTFPANDNTPQTLSIPVLTDGIVEGTETFILELQNASELANFDPNPTDSISILDVDSTLVYFQSNLVSLPEGQILAVEVGLIGGHSTDTTRTTVQYIPGSADGATDLLLPADMRLSWAPGDESTRVINVPIIDDNAVEDLEDGFFVFTNNSSSVKSNLLDTLTLNIEDNDFTTVRFKLESYTVDETSGDTVVEVEILNPHTLYETTVDVNMTAGTATRLLDFNAAATTTLTFPANSTAVQQVSVTIINDLLTEGRENIFFDLANASPWVQLGTPQHELIIRDDEIAQVQMVEASSSVDEAAGTATFQVEVAQAAALSLQPVTVDVVVKSGSAINGSDYEFSTTALQFPAGNTGAQTVTVDITEDAIIEGAETIVFELRNPSNNAEIVPNQKEHELTITDNDFSVVSFAESLYEVSEGGGSVEVFVTITNPSPLVATTVDVALIGGTATNGADFEFLATQSITFPAGSSASQSFQIPILDDQSLEPLEYFELELQNLSATAQYGVSPTRIEIMDNEFTQVQFVNGSQNTGEADGMTSIAVEVKFPSATDPVQVEVVHNSGTATIGSDFQYNTTTVVFAPGETGPKLVNVNILDDTEQEGIETAVFTLENAVGAIVTNGQHTINIRDDEVPQISFVQDSVLVTENSGTGNLLVSIENPFPNTDVQVDVLFDGGTATLGTDIDFNPITLTFPAGSLTPQMVPFTILDDFDEEADEFVMLKLTNATNGAGILTQYLKLKIQDDDGANQPDSLPEYTIAEIHGENAIGGADSLGTECFLTGVVHGVNLSSNGLDFFIHDGTGGINVFKGLGNLGYFVTEGDEIKVRGVVGQKNGLTIFQPDAIVLQSAQNPLQVPIVTDVLSETMEGYPVRMECMEIVNVSEWTNAGNQFLVEFTKNGVNSFVLIDANTSAFGMDAPFGKTTITGIVAQLDGANPLLHNYYLIPMYGDDFYTSLEEPFTYVQNNNTFSFNLGQNDATSVEWDFGDGFGTSTNTNPGYTYFQTGTFTVSVTTTDAFGCAYTQSRDVSYVIGIDELDDLRATVFPNPFDESFNVQLATDIEWLEIRDITGRILHRQEGEVGKREYEVNLKAYSNGVYTLAIKGENGRWLKQKVIKR